VTGPLRIGAVWPAAELQGDPEVVREWARGVVARGFDHVLTIDHVLGADPASHPGREFPYTVADPILEPLVLFGFLAACVPELELATAIVVLPQRQTVLVGAQMALLDVLTQGRTRLGVGLGWNEVEFQALGVPFEARGRRLEEQVALLRALWTTEVVEFDGQYHDVHGAGLNPMPVQRPIPIWFGGARTPALRRAARLGDGFLPALPMLPARPKESRWPALLAQMSMWRDEAGRGDEPFGLEPRIDARKGTAEDWRRAADEWQELGATHIAVQTTGAGWKTVDEHLESLAAVISVLG
jgi:probable F420-dependent oxidoreductase